MFLRIKNFFPKKFLKSGRTIAKVLPNNFPSIAEKFRKKTKKFLTVCRWNFKGIFKEIFGRLIKLFLDRIFEEICRKNWFCFTPADFHWFLSPALISCHHRLERPGVPILEHDVANLPTTSLHQRIILCNSQYRKASSPLSH